jgi:hypothetical protein
MWEGDAPDHFLIGLAVLSMLSDVAEERPLVWVCLVDDAQWLDQASAHTLAFVARRLLAESVRLVFATRAAGEDRAFRQLPELPNPALSDADARALLQAALRGPLDAAVLDEIVAEAGADAPAPQGRLAAEGPICSGERRVPRSDAVIGPGLGAVATPACPSPSQAVGPGGQTATTVAPLDESRVTDPRAALSWLARPGGARSHNLSIARRHHADMRRAGRAIDGPSGQEVGMVQWKNRTSM